MNNQTPRTPSRAEVAADVNILFQMAPPTPISDKAIEVCVVGKRCVYINDCRIAGGKPWHSENLPSHTLKTSLKDLLSAFTQEEIISALNEQEARRKYFAAYHAQPEDELHVE